MQNLTATQKSHLYEGGHVKVTITGETLDGTPVTITEDDIIEGSLSIERNWAHGSTVEIGCADTSELIFELDNSDGRWNAIRWEGTRLTVVLSIDDEPLQAGIFTVDEPPRKLTTMQIRALDDMARFNKAYESGAPYPGTLLQILLDACSRCNVPLLTQSFDNRNYVVDERPDTEGLTYHHIVAWVAELAGCNAWIDHLGRLNLTWYGETGTVEIGPEDRFSYEAAEADIEITGIIHRTEDTDNLVGTNKYALIIEDNPLLQEDSGVILSALFNKLGGFTYRPYSFETLCYPHLWPGDTVDPLIDADGNELTSIITNHTFKLNGNSVLEARGETETVKGYATGAPFTPTQKRVLRAVAKIEAARHTSYMEQSVLHLNELMTNSLGFYSTTVELETGAKVTYTHDQPLLEESQIIWTMTEMGFAWTDQGWNEGAPVWQYGVTADGSIVARILDVIGIKAEWIHVGPDTTFAEGYDPIAIKIGGRNLIVRHDEIEGMAIATSGTSVTLSGHSLMNDFIPVFPGDGLTFSQIIQPGTGDDYIRYAFYTDPLDSAAYVVRRTENQSTEFGEVVPEGAFWLRVSYATKNKVQVERGNRASDWTPAPEDVEVYAEHKAQEAQAAAEAVARAEANLAQTNAKAHADGIVSAEEQARIDDANVKLTEAKSYAETKSGEAQAAAEVYAEQKAQEAQTAAEAVARAEAQAAAEVYAEHKAAEAQTAAEAVARAEATLAQTQAEAYADGKVSAEEQARIDEAAANLADAKAHAEAQVDALDVGGRNIALDSRAGWASTAYNVIQGTLSENWVVGETYTVTIEGTINEGQVFRLWRDMGQASIGALKYNAAKDLWTGTFICPAPSQTPYNKFSVYNYPSGTATSATVDWIKIEKGNKATDWTPAPEDAEQALADHNANPSPHNLPSYAKMEGTGFKVYDDSGNLRTHMGQYAPGEFGSWVDAGHYVLRDKGMNTSLLQLPNLIPDHSFECLERDGYGSDYYDFEIVGSLVSTRWMKIGAPKVDSARQSGGEFNDALHGLQCAVVNSTNYLTTYVWRTRSLQYFVSGFACRGHRSPSAGTAKIRIEPCGWDHNKLTTIEQTFTLNSTIFDYKRVGFEFTVPFDTLSIKVSVLSADSNWVYWDGLQVVEGGKPVRYDPEENLWRHMYQVSGLPELHHVVGYSSNTNGSWVRWSNGLQMCWHIVPCSYTDLTVGVYEEAWTFPVSFLNGYNYMFHADFSLHGYDWEKLDYIYGGRAQSRTGSSIPYRYSINTRFGSGASIELFAIGWWK